MKLRVTKTTKALIQEVGRMLNTTIDAPSYEEAGRNEKTFIMALQSALDFTDLPITLHFGELNLTYAVVDEEVGSELEEVGGFFDTDKMRTFNADAQLANDVIGLYKPFIGNWVVSDEHSIYNGCNLGLKEDSALSQIIVSVLVQKLFSKQIKERPEEVVVVNLDSKKANLKQYEFVSGKIVGLCIDDFDRQKGRAFITRFVLDLRTGELFIDNQYDCVWLSENTHEQSLDQIIENYRAQTRVENRWRKPRYRDYDRDER